MGCCHSNNSTSSLEEGNVHHKSTISITEDDHLKYINEHINDHPKLIDFIKSEGLSLQSVDKEGKTLIRKILEEAGDGHNVVNRVLDSYVSVTPDAKTKTYSNEYGVTVDFSGIIRDDKETGMQKSVLRDILELKMKYQDTVLDLGAGGVTWFHRIFNNDDRMGNKEDYADTFRGKLHKLTLKLFNRRIF